MSEGRNPEASEEHPVYAKVEHDKPNPLSTQMYFVTVDEGWRQMIMCERMYGWAADWLVETLQGQPFAKSP
jgi:hypothetical protein